MTPQDLLHYIRKNPNRSIGEIAKANHSTFFEVQKVMAQLEENALVTGTAINASSANQKVVWNVSNRI